tara:strand:+ start:12 stop:284 length:273 start_codon:yes stop_codon:yes gene_type:complete
METILRAMGEMDAFNSAGVRQEMKIAELHFNEEGEIRFEKDFQKHLDDQEKSYYGILIADIFVDFLFESARLYHSQLNSAKLNDNDMPFT